MKPTPKCIPRGWRKTQYYTLCNESTRDGLCLHAAKVERGLTLRCGRHWPKPKRKRP
jgi:hypothetical protein